MFMRILKWVVGGLVAIVVTFALVLGVVLLFRTEPLAIIPGGRLSGEEVTVPVTDWSFTEQYTTVTLEVRASDPYSVNTSSLLHDGVLYVPSGFGGESRWAQFLLQDSNMRLSTPFPKYGNVCGWGLRGEVAKRGGVDAGTSTTTRDKEIARNPHPPEGLGRDGPIFLLLLLADVPALTRRRASIWAPSRSQQTSSYL